MNSVTQSPVTTQPLRIYVNAHHSPALICDDCQRVILFERVVNDEIGYEYIETSWLEGCSCGGQFRFAAMKELYARDGVYWCESLRQYQRLTSCPRPDCWASKCYLSRPKPLLAGQYTGDAEGVERCTTTL